MLKTFFTPGFHWFLVICAVMANGQTSAISMDNTKGTFDTLHFTFPKSYWFNSYKFSIGDYAKGRSKQASINEAENWSLIVFENDSVDDAEILPTLLGSDTRTILVESTRGATDYGKLRIYSYGSYTFIENDKVLGSIYMQKGNIILLRKDLDPQTKLVLSSAIMALVG